MATKKTVFIDGPVSPAFIAESISKHSSKTDIGGHSIFLGQIRADQKDGLEVTAIEYSTYREMAEEKLFEIREETFTKFDITCMHIYHSLGQVRQGEICLFIFTSSKHRKEAIESCSYLVERIKKEVPIWGKEILGNQNHSWKSNH
ncbi:MAG: molybdenum cofactor biosynthesis protein MoaE [Saprospiraceae bacterium]|nr:molybdenum cofactor biosynthesis protein MoaE [Saprospiraceae bacterium]MBK6564184.1 molybdenum cofactor biosynthesis protein MoaE [Saprospiraceae bacterium]MBK6782345.1 molybdenum cofactor biosynthesis protein MoaE [Saprospiraceae bacterium]MBK7524136.1 molybdenum cofactor biosynthesis protein MoaE [Saprospiraceae bacterium]MBK8078882.1 molybdenum cofactor biosynthesis protein MoaE [Saprospiraceae bacterium]